MRLFVAINFDKAMKSAINGCLVQLGRQRIKADYTQLDNIHLTLAFIGEYSDAKKVLDIVSSIEIPPFDIELKDYGFFGNLLWLGLKQCPQLNQLQDRLKKALADNNIPYDKKPFSPHITIARQVENVDNVKLNIPQIKTTVTSIDLMESTRQKGRLVYRKIREIL